MARPLRIGYPGAWYHVMNRGGRRFIFNTDDQRHYFLALPGEVYTRYRAEIHPYCLISNHYHLFIRTPESNLQRVKRHVNGVVYPIPQLHRGQRRGIVSWALQGYPRRCRHPLARTISLYSSRSLGSPNHQTYRVRPVPRRRCATLGDDWQMTRRKDLICILQDLTP